MSESRERFLGTTLDCIEEREARLLAWGIVDGAFAEAEIRALINPLIDDALNLGSEDFLEANEVLTELLDRKWITTVPLPDGATGYRSRMAETVRLLQRLRQLDAAIRPATSPPSRLWP
jgi:hypothetical protein